MPVLDSISAEQLSNAQKNILSYRRVL